MVNARVNIANLYPYLPFQCFPGSVLVKNLPACVGAARDAGLMPELGRSPREGSGNPLQYSYLENPMDRGAWQTTVNWVTKSQA